MPGASTKAYATIRGWFSFVISSVSKHFQLVSAHEVITITKWERETHRLKAIEILLAKLVNHSKLFGKQATKHAHVSMYNFHL